MTIKQVLRTIRLMGLTATYAPAVAEFRISYRGVSRATADARAYFTPDKTDAIATARLMSLVDFQRYDFLKLEN